MKETVSTGAGWSRAGRRGDWTKAIDQETRGLDKSNKSKKKEQAGRAYSFARYSLGVQPKEALKHLLKYFGSENPQA